MLFLVISAPRPERPSSMTGSRKKFWRWIDPKLKSGQCRSVYARTGRGAVALFEVGSNEELHRLLNDWADIIPAHFEIHPLIDAAGARQFLSGGSVRKKRKPKPGRST
jgi:hypothetical protein